MAVMATNNTLTVLVVEDNRAIQANIADYFTMQGAVVDFALNGRQGAELALQHYYDVIVLDLTLPQLDGLDVCSLLRREASRHIPILMLTARDSLQHKLDGFSAGTDDYLVKPFDLAELWAVIDYSWFLCLFARSISACSSAICRCNLSLSLSLASTLIELFTPVLA